MAGKTPGRTSCEGRAAPWWTRLVAGVGEGQVLGKSACETDSRMRWPVGLALPMGAGWIVKRGG